MLQQWLQQCLAVFPLLDAPGKFERVNQLMDKSMKGKIVDLSRSCLAEVATNRISSKMILTEDLDVSNLSDDFRLKVHFHFLLYTCISPPSVSLVLFDQKKGYKKESHALTVHISVSFFFNWTSSWRDVTWEARQGIFELFIAPTTRMPCKWLYLNKQNVR